MRERTLLFSRSITPSLLCVIPLYLLRSMRHRHTHTLTHYSARESTNCLSSCSPHLITAQRSIRSLKLFLSLSVCVVRQTTALSVFASQFSRIFTVGAFGCLSLHRNRVRKCCVSLPLFMHGLNKLYFVQWRCKQFCKVAAKYFTTVSNHGHIKKTIKLLRTHLFQLIFRQR